MKDLYNLRHGHGWSWQVAFHSRSFGDSSVLSTDNDVVDGATHHDDEVTGGDGKDVGAGDGVGALELESGLGAGDDVEGVAWEGEVDVSVTLGGVEVCGGNENGSVEASIDGVVEEETEGGGGRGGASDLLVGDGVTDYVVEFWAGGRVVVGGEYGFR